MWQIDGFYDHFDCHAKKITSSMKVVVVGDSTVGKTCLLLKYTAGDFPIQYVRTVFDKFEAEVVVDGRLQNLVLWDTPGDEEYDRFRPLIYPDTDVFLLCYSTVDPTSLTNMWQKWLKEIKGANPVIIVVGLKSDARLDSAQRCLQARGGSLVTTEQGKAFAKATGAVSFVECSALKSRAIKEVFVAAVRAGRRAQKAAAVPAATDHSRHHRCRSTWGLVSRSFWSISNLVYRHLP
jgi:small GTP-binding protein